MGKGVYVNVKLPHSRKMFYLNYGFINNMHTWMKPRNLINTIVLLRMEIAI